jgi:hypothetical protein
MPMHERIGRREHALTRSCVGGTKGKPSVTPLSN